MFYGKMRESSFMIPSVKLSEKVGFLKYSGCSPAANIDSSCDGLCSIGCCFDKNTSKILSCSRDYKIWITCTFRPYLRMRKSILQLCLQYIFFTFKPI